jgi:hypothetical protein
MVLLDSRVAPSIKYHFGKNVFTHMLTVHFQVGASRLVCAPQLQSSHCEILDSLSAEAQPDLLIFIHSIHTPVRAYMLQIFLIWKLLRFMTSLAIYFSPFRSLCNQLTLKKKVQIITVQILSCIVTIHRPSKGC